MRTAGGRGSPARTRLVWSLLAGVFALSFTIFVVLFTVQSTVLDAHFYRDALDHADAYNRVYDRVLPDPHVARVTRDLLAGLPVDRSVVDANLRIVLPPSTLRETVNRVVTGLVAYLRKDQGQFDPVLSLEPVFQNIRSFADAYLADAISGLRPLQARSLDEFARNLATFANDLGAGRRPASLPTIPFTASQADQLTGLLVDRLDAATAQRIRPAVRYAVGAGDLSTALATVAPELGRAHTERVVVDLRQDARGTHVHVETPVNDGGNTTIVVDLSRFRFLFGTVLPYATIGSLLVALVALAVLARAARRAGRSAALTAAVTVAVTGVTLIVVYVIVRLLLGDPFHAVFGDSNLAPALHGLLHDVVTRLFHGVDRELVGTALVPVLAGGLVIAWMVVVPRLRTGLRGVTPATVVSAATVTALVTGLAAWLVVPRPQAKPAERCNGAVALCDRAYDEVVYPATHNAMSASDLRWISANQDVPVSDQLDEGIRALLLDTHYWETPRRAATFADSLPPQQRSLVLGAVAAANPQRPGTWLCHNLCRLGATKLTDSLRDIRDFVREHPHEVVTLILEDDISPADTATAFERSGLVREVFTPDPDPDAPWPTLRRMIHSGRRVVAFAERRQGPPAWYANLYRYAMETPFSFTTPADMTCAPNRGGTGKHLFLMNHWIQRDAPSRSDAGTVNAQQFIVDRARRCRAQRGRLPNFVAVDFSTIGDVVGAVDRLNGVAGSS